MKSIRLLPFADFAAFAVHTPIDVPAAPQESAYLELPA